MPQNQKSISLALNGGKSGTAVATGNNAAWICSCGRAEPLLGRSGLHRGPTPNLIVECPSCSAEYFVVPDGGDYKAAVRVENIEAGIVAT